VPSTGGSRSGVREAEQPGQGRRHRRDDALARGVPRDAAALPGAVPRPAETWLRIMQAHDRILRRLDAALRRSHGLSLTAFEVLRRVAEGEPPGAGQAEAAGLTRPVHPATVNRLVGEGLLVRDPGDDDAPPSVTPAGRERLAAATATHDDLLGHLLTLLGDDAAVVTDALARVSRAARPRP
jgi:DNA-binding MarR family transcriptional regulator